MNISSIKKYCHSLNGFESQFIVFSAIIILIGLFPLNRLLMAQTPKANEIFRMSKNARDAEANGQFDQALDIWTFIVRNKPSDYSAYNGVQRCLIELERYDEALTFLDTMLIASLDKKVTFKPVKVSSDRIKVLFAAEREEEGALAIEQLLFEFRGDKNVYREIANVLFAERKSDEAIEVYWRGRKELGNPYLFAREVANFSESRMDWATAISEYILYLQESHDRLSYVTGAIGDMPSELGADSIAIAVIKQQKSLATTDFKPILTQLLATLYFRARDYETALAEFVSLEGNVDQRSVQLLDFAQMLVDEKEFNLAWKSYDEVLMLNGAKELIAEAHLGKGIIAVELGELDSAQAAFQSALQPGVTPVIAFEAYSHLGYIKLTINGSPKQARELFNAALKLNRKINRKADKIEKLEVASALTWAHEGNDSEAEKQLKKIINSNGSKRLQSSLARLELAQLYFRTGNIENALQTAEDLLIAAPASQQANEALALVALANDLQSDSLSLKMLGHLDQMIFLGRKLEVIELLDKLTVSASERVKEEALWRQYKLMLENDDPERALASLELIMSMKQSAYRPDLALLAAGDLSGRELNDLHQAIEFYETLLIDYPDSPLCDQARRRIKEISKES